MAEALYSDSGSGESAEDDAKALGVILPPRDDEPPTEIEVWEENWEAFNMALLMLNEWNYVGMAGLPVGYNKQTMQWYFQLLNVQDPERLLAEMRVIERTALGILSKRKGN